MRFAIVCAALCALLAARVAADEAPPLSEADLRAMPGAAIFAASGVALRTPQSGVPAVTDPLFGRRYSTATSVYVREGTQWWLRFTVHCALRDDLPFARNVGRLLGAIWQQAGARFGTLCARLRERPVDVWLARSGAAGGEHWRTDIYLLDIGSPRTDIEWAREVAHEYGHYLLPGASGYTDPESWANGVLGERLFLYWLQRAAQAGSPDAASLPLVSRAELDDYVTKQVTPLIEREASPVPLSLEGTGRAAFDAFTALMLYADRVYGPPVLMNLLEYLPQQSTHPARGIDFRRALHEWLNSCAQFTTRLPTGRAWSVYIPKGEFRVRVAAGTASGLQATGASVAVVSGGWIVRNAAARRVMITAAGSSPDITLQWTRQ